jgi:hypothetical protein
VVFFGIKIVSNVSIGQSFCPQDVGKELDAFTKRSLKYLACLNRSAEVLTHMTQMSAR